MALEAERSVPSAGTVVSSCALYGGMFASPDLRSMVRHVTYYEQLVTFPKLSSTSGLESGHVSDPTEPERLKGLEHQCGIHRISLRLYCVLSTDVIGLFTTIILNTVKCRDLRNSPVRRLQEWCCIAFPIPLPQRLKHLWINNNVWRYIFGNPPHGDLHLHSHQLRGFSRHDNGTESQPWRRTAPRLEEGLVLSHRSRMLKFLPLPAGPRLATAGSRGS